jgi:amino-acid N-acetyltransferase
MIRKATIQDVKEIHAILALYAKEGILLGRSLSDLFDQVRDFFVSIDQDESALSGAGGLHICWEDIAEIRSVAVKEKYRGKGVGMELVNACIQEAKQLGIKRVFVLTYVPEFFKNLGFYPVDKSVLPHKVWADCINCIKFPDCDEHSLIKDI